jgi:hypothetical protein
MAVDQAPDRPMLELRPAAALVRCCFEGAFSGLSCCRRVPLVTRSQPYSL